MRVCVMVPAVEEHNAVSSVSAQHMVDRMVTVGGNELIWTIIGVGMLAAAAGSTAAADRFEPDLVVLAGTAAGLDTQLEIGDVVLCNRIGTDLHRPDLIIGSHLPEVDVADDSGCGITIGAAITVSVPINTGSAREVLFKQGYCCGEMEGYTVAEEMVRRGIPFCMIRGVSDIPGMSGGWHAGILPAMTSVVSVIDQVWGNGTHL